MRMAAPPATANRSLGLIKQTIVLSLAAVVLVLAMPVLAMGFSNAVAFTAGLFQ